MYKISSNLVIVQYTLKTVKILFLIIIKKKEVKK